MQVSPGAGRKPLAVGDGDVTVARAHRGEAVSRAVPHHALQRRVDAVHRARLAQPLALVPRQVRCGAEGYVSVEYSMMFNT